MTVHLTLYVTFSLQQSGPSELSSPKDKKSEDDASKINDSMTEWSEEEKNRLLDALKKYFEVLIYYSYCNISSSPVSFSCSCI